MNFGFERVEVLVDKQVDLSKLGFSAGDRVMLVDDDWSPVGTDIIVLDVEPVPGSTQCVIRAGDDVRTVSRGELRPL